MKRELVRVIACSGNHHPPINDAKYFSLKDVREGLAHKWASDWGRKRGEMAVIVSSRGQDKYLSPLVTINLR